MKNSETARRLKYALEMRDLRQQDLAERSGVNKASISQFINGTHKPSNVTAKKMAEVLNVSPLWLMGFDIEINQNHNRGSISNNIGGMDSNNGSNTTTNNYYSSPCDSVSYNVEATNKSKHYLWGILDCLRNMTDEQLEDVLKYAEFILRK